MHSCSITIATTLLQNGGPKLNSRVETPEVSGMAFSLSTENEQFKPKEHEKEKAEAYEKQMESYALRNAAENCYFQTLTVEDILGQKTICCDGDDDDEADELQKFLSEKENSEDDKLKKVFMAKFHSSRLRNVGIINRWKNLTICDLSCNYLQKIDPLINCHSLIKLDVHQNQIAELPKEDFWYGLKYLNVLYLHNNGLSTFDELAKLKLSPRLAILTLHDTPVSIKPHYRHFVVNSIWSLKVLDNVIISDEELIEDAKFENNFKFMQPHFLFKPVSLARKNEALLDEEKAAVRADIALVNKVQAKFCPVLILQRCIRGYLTRMRYQYIQDTRLWAAVTIQRFYRNYKGLEFRSRNASNSEIPYFRLSSPRLDYETYIKYRKSRERETLSDLTISQPTMTAENSYVGNSIFHKTSINEPQSEEGTGRLKLRLNINLSQLAASTARIIDGPGSFDNKNSGVSSVKHYPTMASLTNTKYDKIDLKSLSKSSGLDFVPFDRTEGKRDRRYSGKYFTQYQFLGPQTAESESRKKADRKTSIDENTCDGVNDDPSGKIPFRISITKPPRMPHDLLEDMTTKTVEIVRDIRKSIRDFERRRASLPKPAVEKRYPVTTDQKLFIRTHGTMGLTCFRAVDQAYKDRDRVETLSSKSTRVREMKQARELSSVMLRQNKSANLEKLAIKNNDAKEDLKTQLEENKTQFMERQRTYVSDRIASRKAHQHSRNSQKRMLDFVCQNNAVMKALAKHSVNSSKDKRINEKSVKLNNIKDDSYRQKEVIRKFYEHRSLILQSEAAIERSRMIERLTIRSEQHEKKAKRRVKHVKEETFQKATPLIPVATAPARLPPLAIVSENQLDAWEKTPKKEVQPRIHDRSVIWT